MAKTDKPMIMIRKEEVVEGGHHGGAWKVAYADFVTAMMAFFLLMWLLNATTEEQRRGIADYFSPHDELARITSGFGAPFGGRTVNSEGALASDNGAVRVLNGPPMPNVMVEDDESGPVRAETPLTRFQTSGEQGTEGTGRAEREASQPTEGEKPLPAMAAAQGQRAAGVVPPNPAAGTAVSTRMAPSDAAVQAELERREKLAFDRAGQQIRDAIASDPALSDLAKQLMIDVTPEGLRIQLVDADRQPMFASGSSALNERARAVLAKIAPVLMRLPESVSVTGHTDATPYKGGERSNWDLSTERANATRRMLTEAGLPEVRVRSVAGVADRDPLLADDRMAAANRRIAIIVLRDKPMVP